MPSKMIKKIFGQINSGLEVMVKKGKCHRDLKPSNILYSYIDNKKKDFIIKIGDFGLATDLASTKKYATDCGSCIFKAPEVGTKKFISFSYSFLSVIFKDIPLIFVNSLRIYSVLSFLSVIL